MCRINIRLLVISAIFATLITPAIFAQQDADLKAEKEASSTQKSDESKKENEKKDTVMADPTEKSLSTKFAYEYKLPRAKLTPGTSEPQQAPEDPAALAKKLANPVASLISLPFQSNFDFGMGPNGNGFRYTLNVQPVIPIALNKDWNLISRTIVPIMGQSDVVAEGSSQFGLGDTIEALFFSPNKSEPFIWAVGPQVLIPTATNEFLGGKKLGLGPTALILKQKGPWSVGTLAGHFWSVAGSDSRPSVSLTNLQPFVSYSTKSAWTYTLNTESTYDWKGKQWNVPIHFVRV